MLKFKDISTRKQEHTRSLGQEHHKAVECHKVRELLTNFRVNILRAVTAVYTLSRFIRHTMRTLVMLTEEKIGSGVTFRGC